MLAWIPPNSPPDAFPPTWQALDQPNGLLAAGGDLSSERLISAYRRGVFPWYSEGEPILWWAPDPRNILLPDELRVSRSLRKRLRRNDYQVSIDRAFGDVIRGCAAPRDDQDGTWIDAAMTAAYERLNRSGIAHSVECWDGDTLAGGLYGIALGGVFFGESMFSRRTDASKVALAFLCAQGFQLIDCQVANPHLNSLGAREVPRETFERWLTQALTAPPVVLRTSLQRGPEGWSEAQ